MIAYRRVTGVGQNVGNISQISIWSNVFATSHRIFFMPGEYSNIADVTYSETGENYSLEVATYTFTNENHVSIVAEKFEKELVDLMKYLYAQTGRDTHTIAFLQETGPREITPKLFERFFPNYQTKAELFILDGEPDEGGFPQMYYMTKEHQTGVNANCLKIMAESSHSTFLPAKNPTLIGKEFLYILYQSKMTSHFAPERPTVRELSIPNSGKAELSSRLNVEELRKLFEQCGTDKITTATKAEEIVEVVPPSKPVAGNSPNPYQLSEFEENIVDSFNAKGGVNLSDLFNAGVSESITLIGNSDTYVDVFLDMPGIARKMCIYQGKLHMILTPAMPEKDLFEFFGDSLDTFVVCTDDTFPAKTSPNNPF